MQSAEGRQAWSKPRKEKMMIHRFQIQFYGLFLNYARRHIKNLWKEPLKNIRDNTLTDFERRIKEKFSTTYAVMKTQAKKPFNTGVNRLVNETYYRDFFRQLREQNKIYQIQCFPVAQEPGGFFNNITPWRKFDKQWVLKKPYQKFYFPLFRRFNVIANLQGMRIAWVLMPGRYIEPIFANNREGIHSAWEPKARQYIRPYIQQMKNILNAVYGSNKLYSKLSNEVPYASHADGIMKNHQHTFLYDCIKSLIPINRIISDVSHSDFNQLVETEYYCTIKINGSTQNKILTKEQYLEAKADGSLIELIDTLGRDDLDRKNIIEWHGWHPDKFDAYVEGESGNKWIDIIKGSNHRNFLLSTDGTTKGSGQEYIGGTYRNLDKTEMEELFDKALDAGKKHKRFIAVADLPKEVFKKTDGRIIEDETLFDFERLSGLNEVWGRYYK
jgi:hypothetical protein